MPNYPVTAPPANRRRIAIVAGLFLSVLLAGAGFYFWRRPNSPRPPEIDRNGMDPEVAAAIEEQRKAAIASPGSGPAWGRLGMVLAAHDLVQPALECFSTAEKLDPSEMRWPYYQAVALSLIDPQAALPKAEQAVGLDKSERDGPVLLLAELLMTQARPEVAEKHARKALDREPQNARALVILARSLLQQHRYKDSLRCLAVAVGDPRKRHASHALRAEVYERMGDRKRAAEDMRVIARLPADPPWRDPLVYEVEKLRVGFDSRLSRMEGMIESGYYAQAIPPLQALTRDRPDGAKAWLLLGRALLETQNIPGSQYALQKAAALEPDNVDANYFFGLVELQLGRPARAKEMFRKALARKPDFAWAHYRLGECLQKEGNIAGATQSVRDAVRLKPDLVPGYCYLAELLLLQNHAAEAITQIELARKLEPDNPRVAKLFPQLVARSLFGV
jgi:tetratricopeptide (TPR) repeat protein